MKNKKKAAVLRAVIAAVAAVVLLAATGCGCFRMMGGGEPVTDGSQLVNGAYVSADLTYVMDVIGQEKNAGGAVTAYYAAAPIGNKFVVLRFPAGDAGHMEELEAATDAYLQGDTPSMDFHLGITGTARNLDSDTAELLAQWFNDNAAWMSRAGVITAVENYGDYLSGILVDTGRAGGVSKGLAVTAGVIAAVLAVYAAGELTCAELGVYDRKEDRHG